MIFHDIEKVNEIDITTLELWRNMEARLLDFMNSFKDEGKIITDEQIIMCLRDIQVFAAIDCPSETKHEKNILRSFEMICRIAIALAESIVNNRGEVASFYNKSKLYCAIRWLKLKSEEEY